MTNFIKQFEKYEEVNLHGVRLPEFNINKKSYENLNLSSKVSNGEFLRALCRAGLGVRKIFPELVEFDKYKERLERELSLFEDLGYVDYILLIWDITNFAKEQNIPIGHGRGSAAGSLVLYLIGVTGVDPIRHDLLFERFVSRARSKSVVIEGVTYYDGSLLPDVDIDFEYTSRHKIIEYIQKKYKGKTCKILTVGTLQGKLCIKECVKIAGGYDEAKATRTSEKVDKLFGKIQGLGEAFNEGLQDWTKEPQEKYQFCSNREISEIALKIEGLPKSFGVHASAMGVSYYPLEDCCPVQLTKDGELVSSYTKKDVENIMVKVDALGLKTLTILDKVGKTTGKDFREIDFEDQKIYEAFNDWGDKLYGIFQFEGHTALSATQEVKPESLNDLSAINALARPGSISYIEEYAKRKNEGKETPSIHPRLDEITKDTYGFLIYQEQIMAAFHKVFGFTLEEAEVLRRIIGKKKPKEMKEMKPKIYEAGKQRGISEEIVDKFWKNVEAASNYSFNKCIHPDEKIELLGGKTVSLKEAYIGDKIRAFSIKDKSDHFVEIIDVYSSEAEVWEVTLENGRKLRTSAKHKYLCEKHGMVPLEEIIENDYSIICHSKLDFGRKIREACKIKSVSPIGKVRTIDLEVDSVDHNFYANGIIVSNSHSVAYSILATQCAYYKLHYPEHFFCEYLNMSKLASNADGGPQGEVSKIVEELKFFNINLCPPDILESDIDFTVGKDGSIKYGLTSIKGIAEKKIEALSEFRGEYPNKFTMFQAAKDSGLTIGDLSSLIQAGAMNSVGKNRCDSVLEAQVWNLLTDREKKFIFQVAEEYNFELFKIIKYFSDSGVSEPDSKRKIIAETRYETIKRNAQKYIDIWNLNKRHYDLANWYFERKLLGFSYSGKLYDILSKDVGGLTDLDDFDFIPEKKKFNFAGIVVGAFDRPSKSGKKMFRILLSDTNKTITVILFGDAYESWAVNNLNEKGKPKLPKENSLVIVEGSKSGTAFFINNIHLLDERVYLKLSELKNITKQEDLDKIVVPEVTKIALTRGAKSEPHKGLVQKACEKSGYECGPTLEGKFLIEINGKKWVAVEGCIFSVGGELEIPIREEDKRPIWSNVEFDVAIVAVGKKYLLFKRGDLEGMIGHESVKFVFSNRIGVAKMRLNLIKEEGKVRFLEISS